MKIRGLFANMIRPAIVACLLLAGAAAPAAAQGAGDPLHTVAEAEGGTAAIAVYAYEPGQREAIEALGVTLLVSASPGGPLLASLGQSAPWPGSANEPVFIFPGAPPGSYWVVLVIGLTTSTTAPASAWVPLVIPPRCAGIPGTPHFTGSVTGSTVTLLAGGGPTGCTYDRIDIEVGSSPGASDILTFPAPASLFSTPNVPPGTYYLRARAVNAFGSQVSQEIPLFVPGGCLPSPQPPLGFKASVGPGTVTLSWSQTVLTGITFYQILVVEPANGGLAEGYDLIGTVLLPPQTTSVSAPVPPGTYRVFLVSGGPCGRTELAEEALAFIVP
jgi:hypothetical protein